MTGAPPVAALHGASKRFGARTALGGVTLEIAAGTAVGLVGPNGAGKTTLMRLLVGLTQPSAGRVELFGAPPAREALHRVGYMAQAEAVYVDLSPDENLHLFATLAGLRGAERQQRVDDALALTDLVDRRFDRVESLSGGMRRRVSLACAVVHRPALLLLDEPTVGVDPELRAAFWDHFVELRRRGAGLLVSTHHLDEARRCDSIVLLKEGRVLAQGTAAALLAQAGADTIEDAFLHFARRERRE